MAQLIYVLVFIGCPLFILCAALVSKRKSRRAAEPRLKAAAGEGA